jgi:hypothetical protein
MMRDSLDHLRDDFGRRRRFAVSLKRGFDGGEKFFGWSFYSDLVRSWANQDGAADSTQGLNHNPRDINVSVLNDELRIHLSGRESMASRQLLGHPRWGAAPDRSLRPNWIPYASSQPASVLSAHIGSLLIQWPVCRESPVAFAPRPASPASMLRTVATSSARSSASASICFRLVGLGMDYAGRLGHLCRLGPPGRSRPERPPARFGRPGSPAAALAPDCGIVLISPWQGADGREPETGGNPVADIVGYSRLAAADEDRILARLRALRSDLIDSTIAVHHGRIVKRTGDGSIIEFRSVVDAVRCAIEVQNGMVERNAGLPPERRIEFRVGIHLGDVVEKSDGGLMGDGVNIAARLEGVWEPGGVCLSEDAYRQVRDKLKETFADLGHQSLKNIARPVRVYAIKSMQGSDPVPGAPLAERSGPPRLSIVVLPFANLGGDPDQEYFIDGVAESLTTDLSCIRGSFVIDRACAISLEPTCLRL